jgi:hypothetical protein
MKKKTIVGLSIIAVMAVGILMIVTEKKDEYRENEVVNFEKYYLPKKVKQCLKEHGYPLETPTLEEKKECEDYANQIWDEQKVLNYIEE